MICIFFIYTYANTTKSYSKRNIGHMTSASKIYKLLLCLENHFHSVK